MVLFSGQGLVSCRISQLLYPLFSHFLKSLATVFSIHPCRFIPSKKLGALFSVFGDSGGTKIRCTFVVSHFNSVVDLFSYTNSIRYCTRAHPQSLILTRMSEGGWGWLLQANLHWVFWAWY